MRNKLKAIGSVIILAAALGFTLPADAKYDHHKGQHEPKLGDIIVGSLLYGLSDAYAQKAHYRSHRGYGHRGHKRYGGHAHRHHRGHKYDYGKHHRRHYYGHKKHRHYGHKKHHRGYHKDTHYYGGHHCKTVYKMGYYHGHKAKYAGTMCYDRYGGSYIVPGSRHVVKIYDNYY